MKNSLANGTAGGIVGTQFENTKVGFRVEGSGLRVQGSGLGVGV